MSRTAMSPASRILALSLAAGLAGCAVVMPEGAKPTDTAAAAPRPAPAGSAPAAPGAALPPPAAGQPQPFATVTKDAKQIASGLFPVWQKDDKFWLELKPTDFKRPFFLSPKLSHGIGEGGFFGGSMASTWTNFGRPQIVEFRRVHNQVQLVARNAEFLAQPGTPAARAVEAGFSDSLLASTPVASQPHPERKTVLVEANSLFLGDMMGVAIHLQRAYRQGYNLDRGNSAILGVRAKPDAILIETQNHYATGTIAIPTPGGPPGAPAPTAPKSLPDVRSMFLGMHYSLSPLPDAPMAGRRADPRVGYFWTGVQDFTDDLARSPRVRYVNRWRLEKKDPAAAMSEPVKPITFWLDRTIPVKYREAMTRGVLEWNKAFEKIGFKNAIVVQVQPDDADFDTLDIGVASIRWMTNSAAAFGAIGPSHVDPRSGEILDADIGFESLSSRSIRAMRSQILASSAAVDWPSLMQSGLDVRAEHGHAMSPQEAMQCTYADQAAEQLAYALDVLEARDQLDPDSPEAEQFVLDYLTDTTMHEVGHTLGLRHNFRSSRAYSNQQLNDPEWTRQNGLAGSVMDYAAINLAGPGERGGVPFQLTLGPYDYWAIEYAYKPIHPDHEKAELERVAGRSAEPQLAYGTDEDNFLGVDPESLHFDLGSDVVAFAKKRMTIARDLVKRQEARDLKRNEDYSVLRRSVNFALRDAGRATGILARQIGGVRTLRDFPGTGRDPLVPVAASVQREALDVLARNVLSADSFLVSPNLLRRLAPNFEERTDAVFEGDGPVATDYSVAAVVLDIQRGLLNHVMSNGVAVRLLDSEPKATSRTEAFRLSELYGRLNREIWSELDGKGDIPALRRELQREHVNRLSGLLLRPGALERADARSLVRQQAVSLLTRINNASRRADLSEEARAHLTDAADSLREALAARLQRSGA